MGVGIQFYTAEIPIFEFSYGDAVRGNIFGILFFTFMYMWLDQIIPSEFGIPRKTFFFLSPTFWKQEVFGTAVAGESTSEATKKQALEEEKQEEKQMSRASLGLGVAGGAGAGDGGLITRDEEILDIEALGPRQAKYFEPRSTKIQTQMDRN